MKTSKLLDEGNNNWNEREGNKQHCLDLQARTEKENKILRIERCENDILNINKINQIKLLIESKLIICALRNFHYKISREKFEPQPG